MRHSSLIVASLLVLSALPGCKGASSLESAIVCEPKCPAGTTCTASGCIADSPLDLAVTVDADPGGCSPGCSGATPICGPSRLCVACLKDGDCPTGQVCKQSGAITLCTQGCTDDSRCAQGSRCCGGGCVDVSNDPSNCGGCGTTCGAQNATSTCAGGQCAPGACNGGWGDCNADATDGCETNLRIDATSCGSCKNKCQLRNAVAGCSDVGCYIKACAFGYDNCDGKDENGCEAAVVSDIRNCGACGNSCAKPPHATNACINASCQITGCDAGWGDCDGMPANGCETNIGSDAANCGKCGAACA